MLRMCLVVRATGEFVESVDWTDSIYAVWSRLEAHVPGSGEEMISRAMCTDIGAGRVVDDEPEGLMWCDYLSSQSSLTATGVLR